MSAAARRCSHVYQAPDAYPDLHRIAERFVDWDGAFQTWLVEHFMLVRRTIGIDKTVRALDGFPTVALGARMTRPLFPELWNVRVEMSRAWSREGGFAPGEQRVGRDHPRAAAARGSRGAERRVEGFGMREREFPLLDAVRVSEQQLDRRDCRAPAKPVLDSYWRTLETLARRGVGALVAASSRHCDEICRR